MGREKEIGGEGETVNGERGRNRMKRGKRWKRKKERERREEGGGRERDTI